MIGSSGGVYETMNGRIMHGSKVTVVGQRHTRVSERTAKLPTRVALSTGFTLPPLLIV